MKAIMMSIRPQHVANILNGIKTLEIRKRFPKNYVGWVYIYVTHGRQLLDLRKQDTKDNYRLTAQSKSNNVRWSYPPLLNGKVVAIFWCDDVEKFDRIVIDFEREYIKQNACISQLELDNYIKDNIGYAIHITDLEIFNKPKEISEFEHQVVYVNVYTGEKRYLREPLRKAPQSWCYVEV